MSWWQGLRYWMGHPAKKAPSWWNELPADGKAVWLYVLLGIVSIVILVAALAAA